MGMIRILESRSHSSKADQVVPRRLRKKTPVSMAKIFTKKKYERRVESKIQEEQVSGKQAIPMVRFKEMVSEALDSILGADAKKMKIEPKGLTLLREVAEERGLHLVLSCFACSLCARSILVSVCRTQRSRYSRHCKQPPLTGMP